jgi:hypothetical protein
MLRAEGEAQAITTTFNAIHAGKPTQSLLAYQYLRMLPNLAKGESNKVWIIPSELNDALKGLGQIAGRAATGETEVEEGEFSAPGKVDVFAEIEAQKVEDAAQSQKSVQQAIAEAQALEGRRAARLETEQVNALTTGEQKPASVPLPEPMPTQEPGQE